MAPRTRLAHGQRRAQLASTARDAFTRGGYRATTTTDVAKAAGVSHALVTKHFGSKEELFRYSMVEPLLALLGDAVRWTPQRGERDARVDRQTVHDFLYNWAKIVHEEGPFLWAVLRETQDFPDIAESLAAVFRTHTEDVAGRLALTIDRAEFREFDPLVATYIGLAVATMAGLVGEDIQGFIVEAVDIIYLGVLTPAGRRSARRDASRNASGRSRGAGDNVATAGPADLLGQPPAVADETRERPGRLALAQRRAQISGSARDLFLRQGYRATTTIDVAQAAGVSEALVIKDFGSKQELFRSSMIEPLLDMLRAAVAGTSVAIAPGVREAQGDLYNFLSGWAGIVHAEGSLLWAVLREHTDFPDYAKSIAAVFRAHVERVARNLALTSNGPQYRRFDPLVATYTALAAATVAGLFGEDRERVVAEAADLIFLGVLTPSGRRALDRALRPAIANRPEHQATPKDGRP